jgi:hypothetical protein
MNVIHWGSAILVSGKFPNTVSQLLQEAEYGTAVVVKLRYQYIHKRFSTWINTL